MLHTSSMAWTSHHVAGNADVLTCLAGLAGCAQGMTMLQYVKSGLDPTTVAVMLEDGGAVAGLVIAGELKGHCSRSTTDDGLAEGLMGLLQF
jgi:hypothetical protein